MLQVLNPRTVVDPGTKAAVRIADRTTLRDALRSEGMPFLPTWLRINLGWEGDAMAEVSAAYVKGLPFFPGNWKLCGSPLSLHQECNDSGSLLRCGDKGLDPDFDSGFTNYIWGLPRDADGLVICLTLDENQPAKTLAEVDSIHIQIDADDYSSQPEGEALSFVPVMSLTCDVSTIDTSSAVIAGLFVGPDLRYGLSEKIGMEGFCYLPTQEKGKRGKDESPEPPRQDRLQLLPLSFSTEFGQGESVFRGLGLIEV